MRIWVNESPPAWLLGVVFFLVSWLLAVFDCHCCFFWRAAERLICPVVRGSFGPPTIGIDMLCLERRFRREKKHGNHESVRAQMQASSDMWPGPLHV